MLYSTREAGPAAGFHLVHAPTRSTSTLLWASAYTTCGALQGRGLGRNFLRHLRRTRALLHVVDASAEDPAGDYWAVREELRMYNPSYCAR